MWKFVRALLGYFFLFILLFFLHQMVVERARGIKVHFKIGLGRQKRTRRY